MLLTIAFFWSLSFIFMKISVPEFGVYAFVGLRLSIASIIMLVIVVSTSYQYLYQVKQYYKVIFIVGFMNFTVPFYLFAYSANHLPAGINAVLNTFSPLLTVCISHVYFNDRIAARQFFGVLTSLVGVIIISIPKFEEGVHELLPVLAALVACLFYGFTTNITRKRAAGLNSTILTTGSLLVAGVATLPLTIIYYPNHLVSNHAWFGVLGVSLISTALAYLLFYALLQRVGTAKTSGSSLFIPIFGTILGVVLLGERLTIYSAIGSLVVIIGAVLVLLRRR